MDTKTKKLLDFEKPHTTDPLHQKIMEVQDEYDAICEELGLVQEITAQVLSGEIELSPESKNALASMVYAISDKAKAFEFRLQQLRQKPLQRFIQWVMRNPTLQKYFDQKKVQVDLEAIWEDLPDMSEREKFLVTFMLMVWNWGEHPLSKKHYPKTKKFQIFGELRHLKPSDQEWILDWAQDPFYVNDSKGKLIHRS